MGVLGQAFNYLRLASNCNPDQPDVLRETTIASLELGHRQDAVIYGSRAVEIDPGDGGLRANLALALLFSEKVEEAKVAVEQAVSLDPIDEVRRGTRTCPYHVRDLKELRTKGYNISRVDAFSERSDCTRCALTDGGAIDQIRLVTGKNNFRMDYGVLDSRSQRELSTAITNIRSASLVDKSKVFLKQWW